MPAESQVFTAIQDQIDTGALVCPRTQSPLKRKGDVLISEDGTTYPITDQGVPILLVNPVKAQEYIARSQAMANEYSGDALQKAGSIIGRIKTALNKDYRTKASRDAFSKVITSAPAGSLCLSIGGGPSRPDPKLVNLNIGPFPNVDVVADAHQLPYNRDSVDAVYCEAVLEHLDNPSEAAKEIFRVLKPRGKVIAITPFMQPFHGYPYHFQNFTVVGHSLIFSRAGFRVLESGTCVGPTFALVNTVFVFIREYFPRIIRFPSKVMWKLVGACLVPLDIVLAPSASSHVMASTTYVLAEKPE